jgi:hypothetical protein
VTLWEGYSRSADADRTGAVELLSGSDFTIRFNDVGDWSATADYSDELYDRITPGSGLILRRAGQLICNGPVTRYGFDDVLDQGGGIRTVIDIEGVTDEIVLADPIVYPDPARAGTEQTTQSHWRMTGPAEDVLCALVEQQIGPSARPERRAVGLTVAASRGRGGIVSAAIRYGAPNMLAELQVLAQAGGELGFRVIATADGGRRFEVYEPNDRTGDIRYGAEMGNVAGQSYRTEAPTTTYALTLGQGDMTDRLARDARRTDAESARWRRRIETLVDARDTDDLAELQDRADKALDDDSGPKQSYSFTPVDTDNARLLEHVNLGDRVTIYAGPASGKRVSTFQELVRELAGDDDDELRAAVGSQGSTTDNSPGPAQRLHKISADLQRMKGSA